MIDARVVSNYLVDLAAQDNNTLTPMQALKLVYMAHGFSLGMRGRPLIYNKIEAWRYGPVIPDLYHAIRNWGDKPVGKIDVSAFRDIGDEDKDFVSRFYKSYKKFDGIELSQLTHMEGTPWDRVYDSDNMSCPISDDTIEHYYKELTAV